VDPLNDSLPSRNTLAVFDVSGADIRFGLTEDGAPYAVASDYAKAMGYARTQSATDLLDEDEKGYAQTVTPGGTQRLAVIFEDGMWELIFRSTLPGAKAIKSQVKAILREIRETGSYSVAQPAPALPDMATPQGRMAVARMLLESTERELELTTRVADLEPKALAHDTLMAAAKGDVLVRQAAKVLGWKERDLRGFLLDEKLIYRRQQTCGGWEYDFYAAHAEQFNAVEKVVEHTWGSCAHYTLHLTPRGLAFVQMRIGKRQSEMHAAIQGGAR
jgi:prophage antirepressor-like protein